MFRIQRAAVNRIEPSPIHIIQPISEPQPAVPQPIEPEPEAQMDATPPEPIEPDASHPVLLAAQKQAEEIIAAARQESAVLHTQAAAQAEKLRQEAWQNGYIDGRAEAERAAAEARQMAQTDLLTVLTKLQSLHEQLYADAEPELLDLAVSIASKILHMEIDRNDDVFSNMVHNALYHIKLEGKIVLRVSAAEYQRFFTSGEAVYQVDGEPVRVSVVPEDGLEPGACVIDSDGETINASIQSQIDRIMAAFREVGTQDFA